MCEAARLEVPPRTFEHRTQSPLRILPVAVILTALDSCASYQPLNLGWDSDVADQASRQKLLSPGEVVSGARVSCAPSVDLAESSGDDVVRGRELGRTRLKIFDRAAAWCVRVEADGDFVMVDTLHQKSLSAPLFWQGMLGHGERRTAARLVTGLCDLPQ